MSDRSSRPSSDSSSDADTPVKEPKICRVCGDKAKSYNFGGLCCESCKAFFRRSMHKDTYKFFYCTNKKLCIITKENRRSCQFCRLQLCFSIGMEKGWLRTEEELDRMKKSRKDKQIKKDSSVNSSNIQQYNPEKEKLPNFLTVQELTNLHNFLQNYTKIIKEIDFSSEVKRNQLQLNGVQVISLFTTAIRRWSAFCHTVPEFVALSNQDQITILKKSVLQLALLRGVVTYDEEHERWPMTYLPPYNNFPMLNVQDVKRLISPQLTEKVLEFIASMRKLHLDEEVVMLLAMVILFSPEGQDLNDVERIAEIQANYISLLQRYTDWKYGLHDKRKTYAKILCKMSDLRELSDRHCDQRLIVLDDIDEEDRQKEPPLFGDLNNTCEFLDAMNISINKVANVVPKESIINNPAVTSLKQIEEMCAMLQNQIEEETEPNGFSLKSPK